MQFRTIPEMRLSKMFVLGKFLFDPKFINLVREGHHGGRTR